MPLLLPLVAILLMLAAYLFTHRRGRRKFGRS